MVMRDTHSRWERKRKKKDSAVFACKCDTSLEKLSRVNRMNRFLQLLPEIELTLTKGDVRCVITYICGYRRIKFQNPWNISLFVAITINLWRIISNYKQKKFLFPFELGVEETSIHPTHHFSHMHPFQLYSFFFWPSFSCHVNRISSGRTEEAGQGLVEIPWGPAHSARIDRHARIFSHGILFVSVYRGRTLSWRGYITRTRVTMLRVDFN